MGSFNLGKGITNYFANVNGLHTGSEFSRDLPSTSGTLNNRNVSTPNLGTENTSSASSLEGSSSAAEANPEMALIKLAQDAGSGLNGILTTVTNNSISTQFQNTLSTGHGIGLTESAMNQATSSYANSSLEDTGGKIGAMFGGPLGALAGRGIASLFASKVVTAIANSPTGRFDPQAGTTPQSQSSRQPTVTPEEPAVPVDVDKDVTYPGFVDESPSNTNFTNQTTAMSTATDSFDNPPPSAPAISGSNIGTSEIASAGVPSYIS